MHTTARDVKRVARLGRMIGRSTLMGLVMTGVVLGGTAGPAGADAGCGEYSFGFAGTRLLNDGISESAGPYPISLPAGTYDVTMKSFDAHDEHPGQTDQTAEQFYAVLDSGYVSPPTHDIPDDGNHATTVVRGQEIGASTAISVHHVGVGNVNSVDVVCVGFTPASPADVAPSIDAETDPTDAADGAELTTVPVDVNDGVEEPANAIDPLRAPDVVDPLGRVRPVAEPGIEAEVQGQVEMAPVLALTGPSALTVALTVLGTTLIGLGGILVGFERRRPATVAR